MFIVSLTRLNAVELITKHVQQNSTNSLFISSSFNQHHKHYIKISFIFIGDILLHSFVHNKSFLPGGLVNNAACVLIGPCEENIWDDFG